VHETSNIMFGDAIKFVKDDIEIIINDADARYSGFGIFYGNSFDTAYMGSCRYTYYNGATAQWKFALPESGDWEIFM